MTQLNDKKVSEETPTTNFIRNRIDDDLSSNRLTAPVTRFPPEPNGFLHVGHAKAICLNFGIALSYPGARCHLRMDDTNPEKEDLKYVTAIKEDIKWLGFDWQQNLFFASSYFEYFYEKALQLVDQGHAYVCDLSFEEMREGRGTLTKAGTESPYRSRDPKENRQLLKEMHAGSFPSGSKTLRAKIDMKSGNINMRDPVIYRIKPCVHPISGESWNIYPMYDYAHCLSDAKEKITHSLCTLEFQDHRPLYEWFLDRLAYTKQPKQIEFSRLNLTYTIMSKRFLLQLVKDQHVSGWDDPRMPTIQGMRRRGYPASAIRLFCERAGVTKADSVIDISVLEQCVREKLNDSAPRAFAVKTPLAVEITNLEENHEQWLEAPSYPHLPDRHETRSLRFSRHLWIDADDFLEEASSKFFRLKTGGEVRLRYGYIIRCDRIDKDPNTGKVIKLYCTYDKDTLGKNPEGRKVKGVIHWLDRNGSQAVEIYKYGRLFKDEYPARADDFLQTLNPDSLEIISNALVENSVSTYPPETSFQFERLGYFCIDRNQKTDENLVFNETVSLREGY